MKFALTKISRNRKLGPIPSATISSDTCPVDCPLRGQGCYAETGPIALQWKRVDAEGVDFDTFLSALRRLPRRQLWRYGAAGDLPPAREDLLKLATANQNRPVIAFTHGRDIEAYREAGQRGFHINLSADNLVEADELAKSGLSVTVVLPSTFARKANETISEFRARLGGTMKTCTPQGNAVAICPATYSDTTCSTCQICAGPRPGGVIVGFPAHGSRKKRIDERLSNGLQRRPSEADKRASPLAQPRIAA